MRREQRRLYWRTRSFCAGDNYIKCAGYAKGSYKIRRAQRGNDKMEFTITAVFAECVQIELCNDAVFEHENELPVLLDGKEVLRTNRNTFVIEDLQPNRSYTVTVDGVSKTFCTTKNGVVLRVDAFGAVGDGVTDNTAAIQAAVMACPVGGTVRIPCGTYLTGPIFLKSHMTLKLDQGAVLLGDTKREHYPILPGMTQNWEEEEEYNLGTWEGNPLDMMASLITAIDCTDIDIVGPGKLDGNAANGDWWMDAKKRVRAWRPNMVYLCRCENVRMCNVTICNSPSWTLHPYYSKHLSFLQLTIENPYHSPNTDGFDPESCEDVLLLGTVISVGDDCIAIKSGKYYMGTKYQVPTKGVEIRNCKFAKGHGSVTIGSEIAGGVCDVHVEKCIFEGTDRGMRIKTRRGRGEQSVLTDIVFEKVKMKDVRMPITLNMFYFCDPDGHSDYVQNQAYREADEMTPCIGNIVLRDSVCEGIGASFLCAVGLPERPIERIEVDNVTASFAPAKTRKAEVPVMMDGLAPMSGRGIYLQNVAEAKLHHVTVKGGVDSKPMVLGETKLDMEDVSFVD